jgi:hypothetical protein
MALHHLTVILQTSSTLHVLDFNVSLDVVIKQKAVTYAIANSLIDVALATIALRCHNKTFFNDAGNGIQCCHFTVTNTQGHWVIDLLQ